MKARFKQKNMGHNKKTNLLWVVIGLILGSHVLIALSTLNLGSDLTSLEEEEKKLLNQERELTSKLVAGSSLTQLLNSSESLGYGKPKNTFFLTTDESIAGLR